MFVEIRENKFEYHVRSHQKSRDNMELCVLFVFNPYMCQHARGIRAKCDSKL